MSSNSVVISDQRKDSFSDRICDDLCEDLLQWLPIKDKIKLILVSKQFQRCLHTLWLRQKCLDLNCGLEYMDCVNQMNNVTELVVENFGWCYRGDVDVIILESIFKLFPNLCQIKVEKGVLSETANKLILSLITEYCHQLNSFSFDFREIHFKTIKKFSEKFGPKLQTLVIYDNNKHLSYLIERTTGLQSLKVKVNHSFLFKTEGNIRRCLLKDLKNLSIVVYNRIGSEDCSKLVDNNLNLIKLNITIDIDTESSEEFVSILRDISKLKQLKRLDIKYYDIKHNNSYDKRLADSMALISKNCKKLVYFGFNLICCKCLGEKCFCSDLIDSIKNCKQLIKFSFKTPRVMIFSKDILRQISSVFPHLKVLRLKMIEFEEVLTDNDLEYVSQLKHLQVLSISNDYSSPISSVTDSGVLFLINNCNNLREIYMDYEMALTEVTVEAMVEKAVKNPKIYFDYTFKYINNINHKIPEPKNLMISFREIEY